MATEHDGACLPLRVLGRELLFGVQVPREGPEVPEHGAAVTSAGEPAGTLTSPCESPTLEKVIRLAALETRFAERGACLEVAIGAGTASATVEPLPIDDPDKRRPRS
jgi:glycine cleavage system aminomethyltransferase T